MVFSEFSLDACYHPTCLKKQFSLSWPVLFEKWGHKNHSTTLDTSQIKSQRTEI
mgnify:CR=1 FL=1